MNGLVRLCLYSETLTAIARVRVLIYLQKLGIIVFKVTQMAVLPHGQPAILQVGVLAQLVPTCILCYDFCHFY